MHRLLEDLVSGMLDLERPEILVVTGAGISVASGIPTFRGAEPGAIWKTSDVTLATREYFLREPVRQWQWYIERFRAVHGALPNRAHHALADLEEIIDSSGGSLRLVTQNIDTLHEEAGSRHLIKVHGTSDRVRCSRNGCSLGAPSGSLALAQVDFEKFLTEPQLERLPRCPNCDALLRAHVLFFDEFYLEHDDYRFLEAEALATSADLILFVGTSFSVGVTDLYLRTGRQRGLSMWSIDPFGEESPSKSLRVVPVPAEEALPAICDLLRKRSAQGRPNQD